MGMNRQPIDEEIPEALARLFAETNIWKLLAEGKTQPIWGDFLRIDIGYFIQLRCRHCLFSFPYDEDFPEHFCPYCGMPIQWVRDEEGNWEDVRR